MPKPGVHRIVVAALIERGGRYLVQRRAPGQWGAGRWEFPGGAVEEHEDIRRACVRECAEELSVDVEAGEIYEIVTHRYEFGTVHIVFVACRITAGEPRPTEGNDELRWVTPDEMAGVDLLDADRPIPAMLAARPTRPVPAGGGGA